MPSIIQNGKRRYVALAIGAALFGAAVSSQPAAARTEQNARLGCNPSYEVCDVQYLYYSSSAKTNQVGYAEDPCEGGYQLVWGYTTSYVTVRSLYCPY